MQGDFLTSQLIAMGPLDFIRLWVPGDVADEYRWVLEAVREDDAAFTIQLQSEFMADSNGLLQRIGFVQDKARLSATDELAVSEAMREILATVVPGAKKVSLTHGTSDERSDVAA